MTTSDKWEHRARCRGLDPDDFIPEGKIGIEAQKAQDRAIRVCRHCPVRRQCLDLALTAEGDAPAASRFGIFGGLTPKQRHKLQVDHVGKPRQARSTVIAA